MDTLTKFKNIQDDIDSAQAELVHRQYVVDKARMFSVFGVILFVTPVVLILTSLNFIEALVTGIGSAGAVLLMILLWEDGWTEGPYAKIHRLENKYFKLMYKLIEEETHSIILDRSEPLIVDRFTPMILTSNGIAFEVYAKVSEQGDVEVLNVANLERPIKNLETKV